MDAEEALTKANQLSKLNRSYAAKLAEAIATLIRKLCSFINVSKNMAQDQIMETTILLIENFWWLRLEESIYIFKQAKHGNMEKSTIGSMVQRFLNGFRNMIRRKEVHYKIKEDYYLSYNIMLKKQRIYHRHVKGS